MLCNRLLTGIVAASAILLIAPDVAALAAAQTPARLVFTPGDPTPTASMKDGSAYLLEIEKVTDGLESYSYLSESVSHHGNKEDVAIGRFFYKKATHSIRIEVGGNGFKAGTILVRGKDGTIKAKGGPNLFGVVLTLDADSRMLKMPNGYNVLQCDLHTLIQHIRKDFAASGKVTMSPTPQDVGGLPEKMLVVEILTNDDPAVLMRRIYVNPQTKLPEAWEIYQSGKLLSRIKFSELKKMDDLPDSMFCF